MKTYSILIPAYNAEHTLPELISGIKKLDINPENVFVINDGSTDNTISALSGNRLINLSNIEKNRGKGFVLRYGFKEFLRHTQDEYLICMDADLQHLPKSISDFMNKINQNGSYDIIIGKRKFKSDVMPFHRILSNKLSSYLVSILTGKKIPDSQSGYRMIKRHVLENLTLKEDGFTMETEFIIRSSEKGYRIGFVNIPTIYNSKAKSHFRHFHETLKFVRLLAKEYWKKYVSANTKKKNG